MFTNNPSHYLAPPYCCVVPEQYPQIADISKKGAVSIQGLKAINAEGLLQYCCVTE